LPYFTTTLPEICPIAHSLEAQDPYGQWVPYDDAFPGLITYSNTTNAFQVYYEINNMHSPNEGVNDIKLRLKASLWGDKFAAEEFTLKMTQDC
jgi:hypothetical protein